MKNIEYVHDWRKLTSDADYKIADDIDAVFVVKDPADDKTTDGLKKLLAADFYLRSISLWCASVTF